MRAPFDFADSATTLAGAALLLVPVAVLAPLGIAPLAGATAAILLIQRAILRKGWPVLDRTTFLLIAAFLAWTLVTATWSLLPERSVLTAIRTAVICVGGLVLLDAVRDLTPAQRNRIGRALLLGAIIGVTIMAGFFLADFIISRVYAPEAINLTEGGPAFTGYIPRSPIPLLNQAASIVAILYLPVAVHLGCTTKHPRQSGLIAAAIAATILLLCEPAVPFIAFCAGGLVFLIALWSARAAAIAAIAGLLAIVLIIPALPEFAPRLDTTLTADGLNENSISHRLGIWAFSSGRALERPLTGWGFATSRAIPGGKDDLLILGKPKIDAPSIPLHPHNASIQIWLEAGLPALLIVLFGVARELWQVPQRRLPRPAIASLLGMGTAMIAIANMSYGIWQGWWLCAIWLCTALVLAIVQPLARD